MNPRRALAGFSVSTQFENVGDAWLWRELLRLVRARADVRVDLSRCPARFATNLDLPPDDPSWRADRFGHVLAALVRHRLAGGRAYYFLSPGGHHGELAGAALRRAWRNTAILTFMRFLGIRVCLVGTSFDHIGPRHRRVLAARSRVLHRHLVRDPESAVRAREAGMRVDGVIPDLSVAAAGPPSRRRPAAVEVALSFRGDQAPGQGDDVRRFACALAERAREVVAWRVVAQVERDAGLAEAVATDLHDLGANVSVRHVAHDLHAAAVAYAGCSHVLGNRLHALLLGTAAGCAPIAVVAPDLNEKVAAAMTGLGLGDRVLNLGEPAASRRAAAMLELAGWSPVDLTPFARALEVAMDELLAVVHQRDDDA